MRDTKPKGETMKRINSTKIARIFQEPDGSYHISSDALDYLDARGPRYESRGAALYALRGNEYNYTHYISKSGKVRAL